MALHNSKGSSYSNSTVSLLLAENIRNNTLNYGEREIKDYEANLTDLYEHPEACNKTIYFICPDPDPLLRECASITLTSEIEVNAQLKFVSLF